MFVLVYLNRNNNLKRFKAQRYLPKGIIKKYNVIINGKNFHDKSIDSDIKRYKQIRELTRGQSEDFTSRCLLDYEYIKNHYRLIAVDLNRQRELNAGPKTIQQIELIGQSKNNDSKNAYDTQSMFVLTTLEKSKETRLTFFHGSKTVLYKMASYEEARVKLTNTQLNKLNSVPK